MALSAGMRQAVGTAAGWLTLACAAAVSLLYLHEIQGATRAILGLETSRTPHRAAAPDAHSIRIVEIKAGAHGHYFASAEVNGRPVDVLVDSGASIVALTYDDARRAGVFVRGSDYTQRVSTANGFARVAPVVLDRISVGAITVHNVPAAVTEPGSLATSLLGMSFLARLQRVDMRAGTLLLQE
ncbi:MAG TPA: TIGR02281 family clan AA aspartic protease [Hyphomicrobiaceae bacterium]|nr:TIGR02281 family clan AA aspartic protease [Hyphomicrobiaceae bacterium]